jgi:hypothetical protein
MDMKYKSENYKQWNITFAKHNAEEMKLLEWLKTLKHGEFATMTKQFWLQKMRESEKK